MLVSSHLSRLRAVLTTAAVVVAGLAVVGIAAPAEAAGTSTWTGASSTLWSDPGNWGGVAPVPGADLVFPAGAAGTASVNDFAAGTSFGALSIDGSGYDISGNAVTLTVGLATTYASGTSVIGLDVSGSSGSVTVGGGGVLEVNGSVTMPVVLAGGTLSGTGTLNGSGITDSSAATVDPGPSGESGILRYSANTGLNLPASSTLHIDVDGPTLGTGYDQLRLTSGSALFNPNGATLDVHLGYVPTINTSFEIVSQTFSSAITGRFNGISQFGSFVAGPVTFSVGYFNSGIILTVVAVNVPTLTWDGEGTTSNWSEAANWVGDVAPSFAAALVFPAGVAKLAPVNDLAPGLHVTALTIAAPGYDLSGAAVDLAGTTHAAYSSGASAIELPLTLSASRTIDVDEGATLVVDSPTTGAGDLTKSSGGTLRITGASGYSGATVVNAGRLTVDGSIASSSSVQVDVGATLSGDGAVPAVSVSGRLAPSVLSTGNLSLDSGSELSVGLGESGNDEVDVAGTVQLSSPTLSTVLDYDPALGDAFTIVDNDGSDAVVGTFTGLLEGGSLQLDDVTLEISYVGGTGNDVVLTTTVVPTTTTVTSSKPTTVTGEPVTFSATTATTADDAAVPSGTIRFRVGGDEVQAATAVDEDGQVTFTTDSLPVGDTTVVAEYTSSTGYDDSADDVSQTVGVAGTSTALTVPDGPFVVGQSVELSATVSATAPGGGTPAGEVTFYDGDTLLGTDALDGSGVATLSTSELAAGTHSLTAVYEGGTDHTSSTSAAVERTVVKRTTTVTVTSGPATPYGEEVTFTATVTSGGGPVPAGAVRFFVGGDQVQAATALDDEGSATFTTASLPVGDTTVTVEYAGNGTFADSDGSRTHTVTLITTTTALSVPAGPLVAGQSVELSATVSAATSGGGTPAGEVTFYDGATLLGTESLDQSGVAALSTSDLAAGSHNLTAVYGGGAAHASSTSAEVERTVVKRATTVAVTSGPTTPYGEGVTFTATVTSGDAPVPAGTVRFLVGGDEVQAADAVDADGRATFTTSSLPVGDTVVTAEYAGTGTLADSDGSRTHTVTRIATTTTLSVPAGPLVAGQSVELSATVSAAAPGDVTFYDGSTLLGTDALDGSGVATLSTSDLAAGPHSLTAVYEGGTNYASSTSAEVERTVVKQSTTVTVTSGPATSYGTAVTFTATVTSGDAPVPAGTVRFLVGGDEVQAATPVDSEGRASFTTSSLPVGDTTVTAEYAGTGTLADSDGSRTHTVARVATATTVRVTATSLIATVTPVASGTVSFTAGGTPVGTAPLVDGVATLATTLPAGRTVQVVATYAGSVTHAGSTASAQRGVPTITAQAAASRRPSKHGWYRTQVRVTFTCTPGSGALTGPCPATVVLDRSGRGQSVLRTITGADGGTATAVVRVNIDRAAPSLRVKRTGSKLRCKAKDPLSGVATCKIRTKARAGGVVTWVAKATDRAGNVTTRRGHYKKKG